MNDSKIKKLEQRIADLEAENEKLRNRSGASPAGDSVSVPAALKPLFDTAQQTVNDYFRHLSMEPTRGTIEVNDQRYLLVRASALSKDFLDTVQNLYADRGEQEALAIGKNFLFDISHVLGMNDAKNFHTTMNLTDPIARLSAGPVHFAYTGWAFVDISPESNPTPDEDFYLLYNHPYSFEADSWVRAGRKADAPVCIMNAGYSSGWCEESFGIPLTAVEVSCRARGDAHCTFVMSPPHKVHEHLKKFESRGGDKYGKQERYEIPTFFQRKKIEEELKKSQALAEESARSKADFIANISHELRTPLSTILGFGALLKKTGLDAVQRDYLQAISTSGKSLLSIINNILDLSKLDAGKFTLEAVPFSIAEALHSLQMLFAKKAKKKGLRLMLLVDSSIDYHVHSDPMRLTQILTNLLENAIKFTERGRIRLSCVTEAETGNWARLRFSIRDTGIGIPAEKVESVFERFTQADSNTTRRYGGTGLGLSITKQLIELLGGTIGLKSKEGKGSEFYFTLRFLKSEKQRLPVNEEAAPQQYLSAKRVLVAEDTLLNQKLTAIILQNNGFSVTLAENGMQAVELVQRQTFDLILMDIQMPHMDGYEATCIIREKLKVKTPIIAMTAHALAGEREKCFEKGVNDYLAKPFSETDLLFKIGHWVADDGQAITSATIAITDLEFLRKQTRNNTAAIAEMVQTFCEQNPKDMAKLETAVAEADFGTIYKTAHALKSQTAMFGLRALLSNDLTSMEEQARKSEGLDEIRRCFGRIRRVCQQAVVELQTIDTGEAGSGPA